MHRYCEQSTTFQLIVAYQDGLDRGIRRAQHVMKKPQVFGGRSKTQYVRHRRWLPMTQSLQRNLKFTGQVEKRKPPREFSMTDIEVQLQQVSAKIPRKHE